MPRIWDAQQASFKFQQFGIKIRHIKRKQELWFRAKYSDNR